MILFANNIITDTRASAGGMNRADRLDLFKYCLASYSCIPCITEVIVCCELSGSYAARTQELAEYVQTLFPGRKVTYRGDSPSSQNHWQRVLLETGILAATEPILYLGNDDHIFIDYDLEWLDEGLRLMQAEPPTQINTLHISSWPEAVSTVYGLDNYAESSSKRFWTAELLYSDAIQIVNAEYFRHLFFDLDLGDAYLRRTDAILTNWYPYLGDYAFPLRSGDLVHPVVKTFLPLREMVRHFDAYWHINMSLEDCPLLSIPPGFFTGSIRIDYCGTEAREGWYRMNPMDATCPDRRTLEDLPLFWRSRIKEIEVSSDICDQTRDEHVAGRNEAHRRLITAPHNRCYQRPYGPDRRTPAKSPTHYRRLDDGPLPLEERYVTAGFLY